MITAKVFQNGENKAINLPEEFNFIGDEVGIYKAGELIIICPKSKAEGLLSQDTTADDTDVDAVATRLLSKHIKAFEELAK